MGMIMPKEILVAVTWLAVAAVTGIFVLIFSLLVGRLFGRIVEDLLSWVR